MRSKPNYQSKPCARCGVEFIPVSGKQKYCSLHANYHSKKAVDTRKLSANQRPSDYYRPINCAECEVEFVPKTGSAKYCPDHQGSYHWALENPEKSAAVQRRSTRRFRHKRDFGDADIYEKCVERFGETCGICGIGPAEGLNHHLAIDHDHATNVIRGLLCETHNIGLGYFGDNDPVMLRAAADYLERDFIRL